jgi:hypothetical protein
MTFLKQAKVGAGGTARRHLFVLDRRLAFAGNF